MIPYSTHRIGLWTALDANEGRTLVYRGHFKTRRRWLRICRYLRTRMARARLARMRGGR